MRAASLDAVVAEIVRQEFDRRQSELARPEFVTQRSVEPVVGIGAKEYLRLARAGAFATTKERRLVVARTADVVEYFGGRLAARTEVRVDPEAEAFARARCRIRRVGA